MPETSPALSARDAFAAYTVDQLKPLVALIADHVPTRKGELVDVLARKMVDPGFVRALYSGLDENGKAAVREAVHTPGGRLDVDRYTAKYGHAPDFGTQADYTGYYGAPRGKPTTLRLFFPRDNTIPVDVLPLLEAFVTAPAAVRLATLRDPAEATGGPAGPRPHDDEADDTPLHVQLTEEAALHDVHAVLRLIDTGKIGVSATTHRPGLAAIKAVAAVLHSGDFYGPDEPQEPDWAAAEDRSGFHIKSYAWPSIVQTAGFAELSGSKLRLTAAGRKAAAQPAHEAIRTAWRRWVATTVFDEFSRISEIKGQRGGGKRHLTAVAPRRKIVAAALAGCPLGAWVDVDEFFRYIRATGQSFEITRESWSLYIVDQQYGSLGYAGHHDFEILQGRYILAVLFEYAATLGLVDVAYVAPEGARDDFRSMWGADDLPYLSRYDGLRAFRLTPLGAWCLGTAPRYTPASPAIEPVLRVLPNLDVVVTAQKLPPGDELLLGRFAGRTGEATWRLSAEKCAEAAEEGIAVDQVRSFLATRSAAALPRTVAIFLNDVEERAQQLKDEGAARLVACRDEALAQLIAHDRVLRGLCLVAGERHIVYRAADETQVRRRLRELGYPLQLGTSA